MSLNTLKSLANELLLDQAGQYPTGFAYLDALRSTLLRSIEGRRLDRSSEATACRRADQADLLRSRLEGVERQLLLQAKAYQDLFSKLNKMLSTKIFDEKALLRLSNLLEDHRTIYGSVFSPNSIGPEKDGVILPMSREQEDGS